MQRTVYVDVLLSVNLFVDYFLLLWVKRFFALPVRRGRLLAGAAVGAAGSMTVLLPDLTVWISVPLNLLICLCMILAAFAPQPLRKLFRLAACAYGISFAYAGAMIAVWYFFAPEGLLIRNGAVYLPVSPLFLAALTVGLYLLFRLLERITGKGEIGSHYCRVEIFYGGKKAELTGKIDTGNALKEPFSGEPVLIAEEGTRVVPYRVLSGEGFFTAFRPEAVCVICGRRRITARCYVAPFEGKLEEGHYNALVHPQIFNMGKEESL